jgi:hypothetical protein
VVVFSNAILIIAAVLEISSLFLCMIAILRLQFSYPSFLGQIKVVNFEDRLNFSLRFPTRNTCHSDLVPTLSLSAGGTSLSL